MTAWIFTITVSVLSTTLLVAMFVVNRRERKAWAARMEAIEKKHTAALCHSGAKMARSRMRLREMKRIVENALRRMPPDGFRKGE
jgi:hypothetical protein